jgi:hypothetical protein
MKWKAVVLCSVFLIGSASPQVSSIPDAPSIEQCETDLSSWNLPTNGDIVKAARLLTAEDLRHRAEILNLCSQVVSHQHDRSAGDQAADMLLYSELEGSYLLILGTRYQSYLLRHREWASFVKEDEAGRR